MGGAAVVVTLLCSNQWPICLNQAKGGTPALQNASAIHTPAPNRLAKRVMNARRRSVPSKRCCVRAHGNTRRARKFSAVRTPVPIPCPSQSSDVFTSCIRACASTLARSLASRYDNLNNLSPYEISAAGVRHLPSLATDHLVVLYFSESFRHSL